jgi:hypothetical protein
MENNAALRYGVKEILEDMNMATEKTVICGNCKTLAVSGGSKYGKPNSPERSNGGRRKRRGLSAGG